jgi:hypothetical protein
MMADKLVMIPVREALPKATYYLIQRRDSRQTPLTASLITLFRRQSRHQFLPEPAGKLSPVVDKRIEGRGAAAIVASGSSWRSAHEP